MRIGLIARRWGPLLGIAALLVVIVLALRGWLRYAAPVPLVLLGIYAIRRRWLDVALALLAATVLVGGALFTLLQIDLGPAVRQAAEARGSQALKRPLHIGRLAVHLWSGRFVVENLTIEGLRPTDRPFFQAKQIVVSMPWWTIIGSRRIVIDSVEMTDWRMLVEMFADHRHNFPSIPRRQGGPSRFTTVVRSVHAARGQFTFEDGETWGTVAPNLDIRVVNAAGEYRGTASLSAGTVRIKRYLPMRSDMRFAFRLAGSRVLIDRLDLSTDGATTVGTGEVDFGRWPEQIYRVESQVDLPRMREIFFAGERWRVKGSAVWKGAFHVFKGGQELKGDFASDRIHFNQYPLTSLRGSLVWVPDRFEVYDASAGLYGGETRFRYRLMPLGRPTPATALFEAKYQGVDLEALTAAAELRGLRLLGRVSGENLLEYPLGRFADRRGRGWVTAAPPAGTPVLADAPSGDELRDSPEPLLPGSDLAPVQQPRRFPVGGTVTYRLGPELVEIGDSHVATPRTHVAFSGQTAYGGLSTIRFSARSADWQESDEFLASTITAFGSPTGVIRVGGRGRFDGVMTGEFRDPRIEGRFDGDQVRVWDVVWGGASGGVVIEDGYVDVTGGRVTRDDAEVRVEGRFSLSAPRRDGGEEFNTRAWLTRWDLKDLRHAFGLDDYPLDGRVTSEVHLYGRYTRPLGFGRATIDEAVAWGEGFESASGALRFEGSGVRFDGLRIAKGAGTITGAAAVSWDGRYSFRVDGARVPVEALGFMKYPEAPLSGTLEFTASGASTFTSPRYEVRGRVDDLFLKDEGIGAVRGRVLIENDLMNLEIDAASPRLAVSGTGRIALTKAADAELTLRFTETSLDPYVRAFDPTISPYASAIASGTLRIVGQLSNLDQLVVEGLAERLDLKLLDYPVRNEGPVRIALDGGAIRLEPARLVGANTEVTLSGTVDLSNEQVAVSARGRADLAVLQLFLASVRSSGQAELIAELRGPLKQPSLSGFATVAGGRIRHLSLPHALEAINGQISFGSRGIWFDDVVARMGVGGGTMRIGGRIRLDGYRPGQLAVTVSGRSIGLRYPEGFRSVVDADLSLVGSAAAPALRGTVTVQSATWSRRVDLTQALLGLRPGSAPSAGPAPAAPTATLPLQFEVRISAPSAINLSSNVLLLTASADLTLRGTLERPLLFGRAEVDRGEVFFEGKRYIVLPGSTIDFDNPSRIQPDLNLAAETRVRAAQQVYTVNVGISGTADQFDFQLSSDPPLSQVDILSMLFNDASRMRDADLRAVSNPGEAQRELVLSAVGRSSQILTDPITSELERALGLDTVQIRPTVDIDQYQRVNAQARLTIGKRISDRAYVTYSRSLTTSGRDEVIVFEYDQSDRLSWVVSRSEDYTYAIDVRVRRRF